MNSDDTTRTVGLASRRAGWGRELVASLPRSLRRTNDGMLPADIMLVDGVPGWTIAAMQTLAQGVRALVVVEPGFVDPDELAALADAVDEAGADLTLVDALADSAALAGFRNLLDDSFGELVVDGARADCRSGLLLAQLRVLRALGLEGLQLTMIDATCAAIIIEGEGRLGPATLRLRLSGAVGAGPKRLAVTAHAAAATARLSWRGGTAARPVEVTLANVAGIRTLPAIHEGGHRRGLRALLASTRAPSGSAALRAFGRDLDLLRVLLDAP